MGMLNRDQELAAETRIARSVLQSLVIDARHEPRPDERELLTSRLDRALAELVRFSAMDYRNSDFLPSIDEVRTVVEGLITRSCVASAEQPATSWPRRLGGFAAQLDRCRQCAIEVLVAHQGELGRAAGSPLAERSLPFAASQGIPALHHLARVPAEPAPSSTSGPPADGLESSERQQLARQARDCLSDLAALAGLRRPLPDLPWTTGEAFERRLLAALDALVALGTPINADRSVGWDAIGEARRYGAEALVPDPGREFAWAFTLCCIAGEDMVAAVLFALRTAPSSVFSGLRDALALCSNPRVGPELVDMLPSIQGERLRLVLEILRARRELDFARLVPLTAHLDTAVLAATTRALGYVERSDAVLETLRRVIEQDDDDLVRVEAATSLLLHGDPTGLRVARRQLEEVAVLSEKGRLGQVRLVALAGTASDLELLRTCLAPTPRDAELVGWYGHPGLVPWLLSTLREVNAATEGTVGAPHPLETAAAEALHRITGAPLHDPVDGEEADDPTAPPSLDAQRWEAWWRDHAAELSTRGKLRFGLPYEPQATLEELLGPSLNRIRVDGALELGIVVGPSCFEPNDWVERQRSVLGALRGLLGQARARYAPGGFPAEQLGSRAAYTGRSAG